MVYYHIAYQCTPKKCVSHGI